MSIHYPDAERTRSKSAGCRCVVMAWAYSKGRPQWFCPCAGVFTPCSSQMCCMQDGEAAGEEGMEDLGGDAALASSLIREMATLLDVPSASTCNSSVKLLEGIDHRLQEVMQGLPQSFLAPLLPQGSLSDKQVPLDCHCSARRSNAAVIMACEKLYGMRRRHFNIFKKAGLLYVSTCSCTTGRLVCI